MCIDILSSRKINFSCHKLDLILERPTKRNVLKVKQTNLAIQRNRRASFLRANSLIPIDGKFEKKEERSKKSLFFCSLNLIIPTVQKRWPKPQIQRSNPSDNTGIMCFLFIIISFAKPRTERTNFFLAKIHRRRVCVCAKRAYAGGRIN